MPTAPFPNGLVPGFPALGPTGLTARASIGSGGAIDSAGGFTGTASGTVTLTGTVANGQNVTITVNGVSVTASAVTADTLTTLAQKLVVLLNAQNSGSGALAGIIGTASRAAGVITIPAANAGFVYPLSCSAMVGTPATDTITIGGTYANGLLLSTTITPVGGSPVTVNYTTIAGDTNNAGAAASFANAINNSAAVLGPAGNVVGGPILLSATAVGAVITLIAAVPGTAQNAIALVSSAGGAMTAVAGGATFANGLNTGLTATATGTELDLALVVDSASTFADAQPGGGSMGAITFYQGMPREVDVAEKASLRGQGLT